MTGLVTITLSGRFRVESNNGRDLTPNSAKGRGLLALLATQPNFERGRPWLQDKLWSDRGQEAGAASLRQELTQIRKKFGSLSPVLGANRHKVFLDADHVRVIDDCLETGNEFLEGIDVRDQEFSHWLTVGRSSREEIYEENSSIGKPLGGQKSPIRKPRSVAFIGDANTPIEFKIFEKQFMDAVSRTLRELTDVKFHAATPNSVEQDQIIVSLQVYQVSRKSPALRVSIEDLSEKGVLFSATLENIDISRRLDECPRCLNVISKITDKITSALYYEQSKNFHGDTDATLLAHVALRKIFSIDRNELLSAEKILERASQLDSRGIFDAWRAQLFTIQYVERYNTNTKELIEKCEACCANALAADPTNSNVLAAVANARTIVEKNHVAGGELALLSVRANPANPLSWWAFSNAKQFAAEYELAYAAAVRAQELALGTRIEFWTNFQRSLTAALTQRHEEATKLGEISSALAPKFKPPLRYLTALYANDDQEKRVERTFKQLSSLERDFSIDRFIYDHEYPISIMRKSHLMKENKLKHVIGY